MTIRYIFLENYPAFEGWTIGGLVSIMWWVVMPMGCHTRRFSASSYKRPNTGSQGRSLIILAVRRQNKTIPLFSNTGSKAKHLTAGIHGVKPEPELYAEARCTSCHSTIICAAAWKKSCSRTN